MRAESDSMVVLIKIWDRDNEIKPCQHGIQHPRPSRLNSEDDVIASTSILKLFVRRVADRTAMRETSR